MQQVMTFVKYQKGFLFSTNLKIPNNLKGTAHVLNRKKVHKDLRNNL